MPGEMPAVVPMIAYDDRVAALDWLVMAFGLRERRRFQAPDGRLTHAEMTVGDGVLTGPVARRPAQVL